MASADPLERLADNVRRHLGPDATVEVDDNDQVVIRRGDVTLRLGDDGRWVLSQPVEGGTAVIVMDDFRTDVWAGVVRDSDPGAN
jgi:hypothetical protein